MMFPCCLLCCFGCSLSGNAARPLVRDLVKGTAGQAKFNNPDRPAVSRLPMCCEVQSCIATQPRLVPVLCA